MRVAQKRRWVTFPHSCYHQPSVTIVTFLNINNPTILIFQNRDRNLIRSIIRIIIRSIIRSIIRIIIRSIIIGRARSSPLWTGSGKTWPGDCHENLSVDSQPIKKVWKKLTILLCRLHSPGWVKETISIMTMDRVSWLASQAWAIAWALIRIDRASVSGLIQTKTHCFLLNH